MGDTPRREILARSGCSCFDHSSFRHLIIDSSFVIRHSNFNF